MYTTRRTLLKTGAAIGLASLGWIGTLVPELRMARASQIPKARVDLLSGAKLSEAVENVLSRPHVAALSAHLTERGFSRTGQDQVAAIQSDARGQDQLTYVWYANSNGDRARLTELASNSKLGGITFITGGGPYVADSYRASDSGEIVHVEHGVLSGSHVTVTFIATGETKSYDLGPVPSGSTAKAGAILDAEACWGNYCGGPCDWLNSHACSIACGLTGTLFCTLCCWWNIPLGVACGVAWVFICEYGWTCNSLTCCLVGLCCCA